MNRLNRITPPDRSAEKRAGEKWNSIAKPLHGLGLMEEQIIKIAGITGSESIVLDKRCAVIMCADNGIVCEGVTQSDSSVTAAAAKAIAEGTSSINCLARVFDADVFAVDMGMCSDVRCEKLISRRIADGTGNIAAGRAMSVSQVERALSAAMDIVRDLKGDGYKIIVSGEMGIGNTSTASAIASVLLDLPVQSVTGRGAGLDDEGLRRKCNAINRAIEINKPDRSEPLELLAKLGGSDIAGMTGLFLGGAVYRVPIVIDGFISAVSAALAVQLAPLAGEYILCSHVSKEPAGKMILDLMGLKPIITAEMHLGEGTGGIMLLPLLDGALSVYDNAHRFEDMNMERYVDFNC